MKNLSRKFYKRQIHYYSESKMSRVYIEDEQVRQFHHSGFSDTCLHFQIKTVHHVHRKYISGYTDHCVFPCRVVNALKVQPLKVYPGYFLSRVTIMMRYASDAFRAVCSTREASYFTVVGARDYFLKLVSKRPI